MTGTFLFSTEITGGWVRGYTIVLYFDPVTEHAVFSLAEQIAGCGISSKFLEYQMRPHITLACCSNVDETQCVQLLEGRETHKKAGMPWFSGDISEFKDRVPIAGYDEGTVCLPAGTA